MWIPADWQAPCGLGHGLGDVDALGSQQPNRASVALGESDNGRGGALVVGQARVD